MTRDVVVDGILANRSSRLLSIRLRSVSWLIPDVLKPGHDHNHSSHAQRQSFVESHGLASHEDDL